MTVNYILFILWSLLLLGDIYFGYRIWKIVNEFSGVLGDWIVIVCLIVVVCMITGVLVWSIMKYIKERCQNGKE